MTDDRYRVFTTRHDVELDAAWLVAHPEYGPFADARAAAAERPAPSSLSDGGVAEVLPAIGGGLPDLDGVSVVVLVDQSGSQRGREGNVPIADAADRIVECLTGAGADVEVLGFTTLRWKGGLSRRDWVEAGRPPAPGRLNDLLHIVYKRFGRPWRGDGDGSPRRDFDFLCRPPYMREGIDGEALRWAVSRLDRRGGGIVVVLSDCAPVDDSTMSVNPDGLLRDHLAAEVAAAESAGVAVISIENRAVPVGAPELRHPYSEVAYRADDRDFDPVQAAAAALRAVAAAAERRPTPLP